MYKPPAIVMSTAATPANVSAPLVIRWKPADPTEQFYVYLHFMEIQELATNETREFNILENGKLRFSKFSPRNLLVNTFYSSSPSSGKEIIYSLEKTENSTLPPIINALEIYSVIDFPQSDTFKGDGMPQKYDLHIVLNYPLPFIWTTLFCIDLNYPLLFYA